MGELKKSPFQMRGFHIQSIHFDARTPELTPDDFTSELSASRSIEYNKDIKSWVGMILLKLNLIPNEKQEDIKRPTMFFKFAAGTIFTMEAEDNDQARKQFDDMLKLNGMVSTMSSARTNLIQLSMQLGISPPIIVPNVDLRKFEWNEAEM